MKKSQARPTTARNVEDRFEHGEDVLDYFDVRKGRLINPNSREHGTKTKFVYPANQNSQRPVVREKSARYRKKTG